MHRVLRRNFFYPPWSQVNPLGLYNFPNAYLRDDYLGPSFPISNVFVWTLQMTPEDFRRGRSFECRKNRSRAGSRYVAR